MSQYITYGKYSLQYVFDFIGNPEGKSSKKISSNGTEFDIKLNSARYKIFKKNPACVKCGIVGTKFLLQKDKYVRPGSAHFNLYAEENGKDILMTKHHIVPLADGGTEEIENLQTMCATCATKASSK